MIIDCPVCNHGIFICPDPNELAVMTKEYVERMDAKQFHDFIKALHEIKKGNYIDPVINYCDTNNTGA